MGVVGVIEGAVDIDVVVRVAYDFVVVVCELEVV